VARVQTFQGNRQGKAIMCIEIEIEKGKYGGKNQGEFLF